MIRALPALAALCLALPSAGLRAEEAKAAPPPGMEAFQLVFLRRGPAWTPQATPETQRIQAAHLEHLGAMARAGKMVAAGPLGDQPDETLRGICVYRAATLAEARALAEGDPAVKAGRLKVEVMTWWVQKGAMEFPISARIAAEAKAAEGKPGAAPVRPAAPPAK